MMVGRMDGLMDGRHDCNCNIVKMVGTESYCRCFFYVPDLFSNSGLTSDDHPFSDSVTSRLTGR